MVKCEGSYYDVMLFDHIFIYSVNLRNQGAQNHLACYLQKLI